MNEENLSPASLCKYETMIGISARLLSTPFFLQYTAALKKTPLFFFGAKIPCVGGLLACHGSSTSSYPQSYL